MSTKKQQIQFVKEILRPRHPWHGAMLQSVYIFRQDLASDARELALQVIFRISAAAADTLEIRLAQQAGSHSSIRRGNSGEGENA